MQKNMQKKNAKKNRQNISIYSKDASKKYAKNMHNMPKKMCVRVKNMPNMQKKLQKI